jgi:uncharacterized FlaG/YvyC family protein
VETQPARYNILDNFKKIISMDEPLKITDQSTGQVFEIPPEGSLGLLALGSVALKPWRKKRIDSGYEAQLLERVKEHVEEAKRKFEERRKKIEEAKLKKQQENNEQANS